MSKPNNVNPSIDGLVDCIYQAEEYLLKLHKEKVTGQNQAAHNRTAVSRLTESQRETVQALESARESVVSNEVKVFEGNLSLKVVNEEIEKSTAELTESKARIKSMNTISQTVDELVKTVMDFHRKVMLDDPSITTSKKSQEGELHQLQLEKRSLLCQLQVLEDSNHERESVLSVKEDLDKAISDLKNSIFVRETELKNKLKIEAEERHRLSDPNNKQILGKKNEVKNAAEEGDWLKATLLSMKDAIERADKELKSLMLVQLSEPDMFRPHSQPQAIPGQLFASQNKCQNLTIPPPPIYPSQTEAGLRSFCPPANHQSGHSQCYNHQQPFPHRDRRQLPETYGPHRGLDKRDFEADNCARGASHHTGSQAYNQQRQQGIHQQGFWKQGRTGETPNMGRGGSNYRQSWCTQKEGKYKFCHTDNKGAFMANRLNPSSCSERGTTPSTPQTFTRNPAPPTPQENAKPSTLPMHLLGGFLQKWKRPSSSDEEEEDSCEENEINSAKEGLNSFEEGEISSDEVRKKRDTPFELDAQSIASTSYMQSSSILEVDDAIKDARLESDSLAMKGTGLATCVPANACKEIGSVSTSGDEFASGMHPCNQVNSEGKSHVRFKRTVDVFQEDGEVVKAYKFTKKGDL